MKMFGAWQFWAMLSAVLAALTAIFAKVGIEKVNSDFATLLRTIVILIVLSGIVAASGQWQPPHTLARRTLLFLVLSGLATGASWISHLHRPSACSPAGGFTL
jgi:transporter family protein